MKAYIFINIAPGKREELEKIIPKDERIKEWHLLMGEYDAVVEVKCSLKELQEILDKIRKSRIVEKTNTMVGWS